MTEANGIPISVVIAGANRHDMKLVADTLLSIKIDRPMPGPGQKQGLCMDKGYDYPEVYYMARLACYTPHIRSRKDEKRRKHRGAKARRWVVERTHSWMNRFRRLLIRWEKDDDTYEAMVHLACGIISWRASGLLK